VPKKTRKALHPVFFISIWLVFLSALWADVRLPAVIGDHMVIQRDKPIQVWGWADPGEKVTVLLSGREMNARAGDDGWWRVVFKPLQAGGDPLEMAVRGEKGPEIAIRDIMVGEVWLCSGQSNMEWPLSQISSSTPEVLRAEHPRIRLFLVPRRTADRPQEDVEAEWTLCTPETAAPFSAVAYYYGLELYQKLGIPIGLIESAWGGTAIEPWTPPAGFAAVPETAEIMDELGHRLADYRNSLAEVLPSWETWVHESRKAISGSTELPPRPELPAHPLDDPQAATSLYNGMIHPLIHFSIRGAIWYQGESNRNDCLAYEYKMEALIRGWREVWNLGDFPFYYVQLAPYDYAYNREDPGGDVPDFFRLPLIWEAQTRILRLPATGMAVTTDITDLNDIHPRNKKDVGIRLALWARAGIYGESELCPSGPLFKSMSVEGDRVRIVFDYAEGGLISNDEQPLRWFEIAAEDHVFHKAVAEVDGETVVVRSPRVAAPKAVRFGWHQTAVPNLANRLGLPASPFRTDAW
jgi:sialate O-acetylesterase